MGAKIAHEIIEYREEKKTWRNIEIIVVEEKKVKMQET